MRRLIQKLRRKLLVWKMKHDRGWPSKSFRNLERSFRRTAWESNVLMLQNSFWRLSLSDVPPRTRDIDRLNHRLKVFLRNNPDRVKEIGSYNLRIVIKYCTDEKVVRSAQNELFIRS